MSREPFAKLHASQAIEDLLADSANNSNQQNWLLSYLDVFVLIIMLVITLLAITDKAPPSQQQQSTKKVAQKQTRPGKKNSEPRLVVNKTAQAKLTTHSNKKQELKEASVLNPPTPLLIEEKQAATKNRKSEIKELLALKPEGISPVEIAKKTPPPKQENPDKEAIKEAKKNKDSNKSNTAEPNLQTEKLFGQEPKKTGGKWQDQLKKQLDHFDFVNVKINQGYAQIEIQDNILFDSAKALLTDDGKALLKKLAVLLKQSTGIIFIEGHTDNQPIATQQFPSNWELGSARATSVLHFLTSQELNGQRLRAVTYADTMPVADNFTEEGRRKNRRVNLLVKIPEI